MMKLSDLLDGIYDGIGKVLPKKIIHVTGLALDSRQVKPGDLFFAYQGTQLDGRKFIDEAIQKGACCVLMEGAFNAIEIYYKNSVPIISLFDLKNKINGIAARFYSYPANKLKIIGVTGTSGKTSCTHFIAEVLQQLNLPCGLIGSIGNGIYGAIQPSSLTTPDAITLQKIFSSVSKKTNYVAMEVSSHSLDQGRVKDIPFFIGVFTNLTHDHLDYHGTMESYGAAKKILFDSPLTEYSVINSDDPFGQTLIASFANKKNIIAYGMQKTKIMNSISFVRAENIQLEHEIRAHVVTPWGEGELKIPLMGQFNLSNMLAVIAVLGLLKIPFSTILKCVAKLTSVPGRMQVVGGQEQPLIVVDHSHKPDSLEKVLLALRPHCQGQLYCVFGCGGDRDRAKRPLMAAIAERYADHVIVTDDNPRTEDPKGIVADILRGFRDPTKIIVEHDRFQAIARSIQCAKRGDCVLIAGKGAETYQQIGDLKIPFSDVEKVKEILNARLVK
ncbi:MAG: murE [Gammaproteobacteria bacterium]|nr:murE [Gammaproteobacteria bacterium]